ncbi:PAS domain S-box protein [Arthrobacter sp. MMS24-T111]
MSDKSGSPRVRDVLGVVLVVQVVFAVAAAAIVILDPEGVLNEPRDRLLAGLIVLAPIAMAFVLTVRFRSGHRAERRNARATAQLMDTVLTTSQEWVWAVDDQGRFTFSSSPSENLLGWTPEELLGQRCDLVIDAGDLVRAKGDVAAAGGPNWTGVVVRCRHPGLVVAHASSSSMPCSLR